MRCEHRGARTVVGKLPSPVPPLQKPGGSLLGPGGMEVTAVKKQGCPLPLSWLKVVTNRLVRDFSSLFAREMWWIPSVTLLMAL